MSNYFIELGRSHARERSHSISKNFPLTFQLPQDKLNKLDFYCQRMGINRTKFISMLVDQKILVALGEYMKSSGRTIEELDFTDVSDLLKEKIKLDLTLQLLDN